MRTTTFGLPISDVLCEMPGNGGGGGGFGGGGFGGGTGSTAQPGSGPAGSGSAGQPGGRAAATGPTAGSRTAEGQPGAGGGGSQEFSWSDSARYRLEDGRILTGAELRAEYDRTANDNALKRYQRGYDLLMKEAQRLDALRSNGGRQPQQPTQAQEDAFADIWQAQPGQIDGAMLQRLVRQGFGPVLQHIGAMQKLIQDQSKQLTAMNQRFGSQDEDAARDSFDRQLDQDFGSVALEGYDGVDFGEHDWLRELAHDLYLSHVPSSWKPGEFRRDLAARVKAIVDGVHALDNKRVEVGRQRMRQHFITGRGNAQPGGQTRYQFETGRQMARRMREGGYFDQNANAA